MLERAANHDLQRRGDSRRALTLTLSLRIPRFRVRGNEIDDHSGNILARSCFSTLQP